MCHTLACVTCETIHTPPSPIPPPIRSRRARPDEDDTAFVIVLNLSARPQAVSLDVFAGLPAQLMVAAAGSHSTYRIG